VGSGVTVVLPCAIFLCAASSFTVFTVRCCYTIDWVFLFTVCSWSLNTPHVTQLCFTAYNFPNCEVREKTNKMQQSDVYYQHFLNMFRTSLCPSLGEQGPCVTARGVLRWFCWMWLVAVVGRCVVGCEHCEGYCSTFPSFHTQRGSHTSYTNLIVAFSQFFERI